MAQYLQYIFFYLQATSPCAMKALKSGPPTIFQHIRINAELINTPGLGSEDNVAFTAAQVNIAPIPVAYLLSVFIILRTYICLKDATLQEAMGDFGGEHCDAKDAPGYYTNMIAISDLPDSFDPGQFFILVPGVFFILDNFASITFSGLRTHGGTAPIAPLDYDPTLLEWAYRFVIVMYPPNGQTAGNQRYLLEALPNHQPFFIPPEMTRAEAPHHEDQGWCAHAAYLEDGHIITTQKRQLQFVSRALYSFCLYMIAQLPPKYQTQIDMDKFLQSFSALDQNGVQERVEKWEAGPGHCKASAIEAQAGASSAHLLSNCMETLNDIMEIDDAVAGSEGDGKSNGVVADSLVSQEPYRQVLKAKWEKYCVFVGGHIPYAVALTNGVAPLDEDDNGGVIRTGFDLNSDGKEEIEPHDGQGGRPAGTKKAQKRKSNTDGSTSKKRQRVDFFPQDIEGSIETITWHKPPSDSTNISSRLGSGLNTLEFPFLKCLTQESIEIELTEVEESIYQAIGAERTTTPLLIHSNSVIDLQNAIWLDPLSENSLTVIFHGLNAMQQFEACERHTSLTLRKQHAGVMTVNYLTWFWLDVYIADQCLKILHNPSQMQSSLWLTLLVSTVKENYSLRRIVATIVDILRHWLGFSQDDKVSLQAQFIHATIHTFGTEFLFLNQCWQVYQSITRPFFQSKSPPRDSICFLEPLTAAIKNHPLYDTTSPERSSAAKIAKIIEDYFNGRLSLSSINEQSAFSGHLPAQLQDKVDGQTDKFRLFIEDSLRFLDSSPTPYHFPKLQKAFSRFPNKLLPFCELAPSRLHLRGHQGPFQPHVIRTTEGIFSAVVWRAITFGTKFAQNHTMQFRSAAHFDQVCEAILATGGEAVEDGKKYFCNGSAYGPHNPSRKVELAHKYWKFLQKGSWSQMLLQKSTLSFQEAYLYFTGGNFPQLGPLGGYLLVADLTYSGVVQPPTTDEIGVLI
ncbi:hypothetical protein CPB83DRAFT_900046 [Crepidotus variabilis]|uniref:Uncharacterized protein n=1 Tax=Crepidotus variabilis TaxID=179855 RepID=A0A9P6JIA4_9AGAR|nr:hypothetical protein CPB83DRAFT_900046 [Crepidotus variabilis]